MINADYELIKNCKLSDNQRRQIIEIKQQYWEYSYESQAKWISENIGPDDLHLIAYVDCSPVAYLDIVNVSVQLNHTDYCMSGIGNVCVDRNHLGKGFGKSCVNKANDIITSLKSPGVLLCHDNLVTFYQKCGWILFNSSDTEMFIGKSEYCHNIMFYNFDFLLDIEPVTILRIRRNF